MADNEADRTEDSGTDEGADSALDSALDALVGLGEEAETEPEDTETAAEETPEPDADDPEETPAPPTAESLGYDLKNPKDKAAYEAMVNQWGKWTNRFHAKLKAKPEVQPEAQAPPPPSQTQEGAWDPYTVPLDEFVYDGGAEPDDSGIAGFEKEIDRRVTQGVKKAIEFTLNQMRVNDGRLREQQQVGTAQERIAAYAQALQAHPEYEEKAALVAKIAKGTRDLAIQDPEEWISMVEARTGIYRNWREATPPRGQQPQRPSKSPSASVPRPTTGARVTNGASNRTDMDLREAADRNYARIFGH